MEQSDSLMKFKITNDKLKMEIKISDLVWLFKSSPNNMDEGGNEGYAKVKPGKRREFAAWIVEQLKDQSIHDDGNPCWGQMFQDVFDKILDYGEYNEEFISIKED